MIESIDALVGDVTQLTQDYERLSQQVDNLESIVSTQSKIVNLLIDRIPLEEAMFQGLAEAIEAARINTQPKDN